MPKATPCSHRTPAPRTLPPPCSTLRRRHRHDPRTHRYWRDQFSRQRLRSPLPYLPRPRHPQRRLPRRRPWHHGARPHERAAGRYAPGPHLAVYFRRRHPGLHHYQCGGQRPRLRQQHDHHRVHAPAPRPETINLPLGWFNADATGRASHLAVKGTMFVASAAMDVLVPYIGNIVSPLTLIIVSLIFDWRLGLCLLVGAPLIYGSAKLAMWLNNRADVYVHSAQINTDTRLLEFGRAQVSLRAAGLTGSDYQPLAEAIERQRKAGRGALWASVISMILQNIVVQLLFAAVVSLAVYLAMGGADPVLMLALIGLLTQFVKPLQVIAEVGTTLRTTDHELEDITEILNLDPMPEPAPEAATALPAAPADYDIAVQDVHFRYRPDLPEILHGASFQLPAGSMTALVGASGSGKTTITRLIARFWDVTSGSITIAGKDIRSYTTADLMSMLSLVFQDIYLFDDTLEANIAYGNPQASAADIRAAAERAGVTGDRPASAGRLGIPGG
ncbi:MAG: ABC transporter ATP-binding protein [Lawsonella clevelandensis]